MSNIVNRNYERGAVSLFVVIFSTLLVAIVTVSFVSLMLRNQQQASDNDLSQSAYDAARAGVEDAKRLLLLDQACQKGESPDPHCNTYHTALASGTCNTLEAAGLAAYDGNERDFLVSQSVGDNKLNQAYTCVSVTPDTDDYKEPNLAADTSTLVPLKSTSPVTAIEINWFSDKDNGGSPATFYNNPSDLVALPPNTSWGTKTPSLLRATTILTKGNFTLDDFTNNTDNAGTLFLYPATTGSTTFDMNLDGRRSGAQQPQRVTCTPAIPAGGYACTARLVLSTTITPGTDALLRLTPLYNATSLQVRLLNNTTYVPFNDVQPLVDATGRANDLFRRISARVSLSGYFPYPEGVDVTKSFCKDFTVTASGYADASACDPSN